MIKIAFLLLLLAAVGFCMVIYFFPRLSRLKILLVIATLLISIFVWLLHPVLFDYDIPLPEGAYYIDKDSLSDDGTFSDTND